MQIILKEKKITIIDYLLTYLLIGFSVIPFFSGNPDLLAYTTIILFLYVIKKQKIRFERNFIVLIFILILMYIGQFLTLGIKSPDFRSIFGTFVRFIFPFLVLYILGDKFFETFVRVVFFLTVIGLTLWLLENFFQDISDIVYSISVNLKLDTESNENILIYNSEPHRIFGIIRNAGFAYEGGAYSIILIIAIIFSLHINRFKIEKKIKILIFAILTTFSTAGYIALFIIIYGIYYSKNKSKFYLVLFSFLLFGFYGYLFTQLDFLQNKIMTQTEIAQNPYETRGRFASALADFVEWQRNPVFGVGKFNETRFKYFVLTASQHRVNGLFTFLATFGFMVFITYLVLLWHSLKKNSIYFSDDRKFYFFQFISLLALYFSQDCLQWSVLIALLYLPTVIQKDSKNNEKKYSIYLS